LDFWVFDGSSSASAFVIQLEHRFEGTISDAFLSLETPVYSLHFGSVWRAEEGQLSMDFPISKVSFSADSHDVRIAVGGEEVLLIGSASFSGIGFAVVPEPGAAFLLMLGVAAMSVLRERREHR
jgi:hypothetical protein